MLNEPSEFGQGPKVCILAVILLVALIASYVWLQAFGSAQRNPPRGPVVPISLR